VDAAGYWAKPRRPWLQALWCFLTFGVYGVVWHARANAEVEAYGGPREGMPFAYIEARPAWSAIAALAGGSFTWLLWLSLIGIAKKGDWGVYSIMGVCSLAATTLPVLASAHALARRMRTAQMLAGVEPVAPRPLLAGILSVLWFPAWCWYGQRALNRVWRVYSPQTQVISHEAFAQQQAQPLPGVQVAAAPLPAAAAAAPTEALTPPSPSLAPVSAPAPPFVVPGPALPVEVPRGD
jgi:hypothetical protein